MDESHSGHSADYGQQSEDFMTNSAHKTEHFMRVHGYHDFTVCVTTCEREKKAKPYGYLGVKLTFWVA